MFLGAIGAEILWEGVEGKLRQDRKEQDQKRERKHILHKWIEQINAGIPLYPIQEQSAQVNSDKKRITSL